MDPVIRTLLIEDEPDYAQLVRIFLTRTREHAFEVGWAETLQKAFEMLAKNSFDIILTDLSLPDSNGLDTFLKLHQNVPNIPIVVISGLDSERIAVDAVRAGAQDYLVKGDVDSKIVSRVLRYAIERHHMQMELKSLSLTDELTGLRNRRGFLTLAEQQVKLSLRTKKGFSILLADIDGLKKINDTYGHSHGDQALVAIAKILEDTFRKSDIVARIGGDEFAVFVIDTRPDTQKDIMGRLQSRIEEFNQKKKVVFNLSLSSGIIYADPGEGIDLMKIMNEADKGLYQSKRDKKKFPA